jgi:quercetin 2,3-dioxygenase
MIAIRRADERGHFDFGWLDTHHTFSFGDYHDPDHMGFRVLRVINDDVVAAGGGFPTHGHRDMEIITYVLDGAVAHEDSMGNGSIIRAGDVQRMSAGTGVMHSEFNGSKTEPLHLLQIWVLPNGRGLTPGYEQKDAAELERRDKLRAVVTPDGRDGSLRMNQDAVMLAGQLSAGTRVTHDFAVGRHGWLHVAKGKVRVADQLLGAGDGAAISLEKSIVVEAIGDSEVLLFDLP